ncbi:MAG: phage tail tape measure protein [Clostridiales bacterium]|nr:phage tail tape measure protein [Clostridiales bacterium]
MAQKQYSFDFVLNAVLNGGFSGTFTKAQQEFIRLGNEIKNLQAIQRDIAAYQKQAAAVENTSGKLENLRRQYELVNKQICETTGSTTALEREKLKLEQRISSTEAALEKQRAKLDDTKARLDEAGVSTDHLAAKDAELTAKIQELTVEQKKAAEGAVRFGDKSAAAIEAVGGAIAAAGIAEAMKGIADAYMECVEVAADFEQAMSAVEAIANSSTSEMAALTAEAKELGATTKFTAQQSANAMEYMAMAGWDAQEMLNGMSGVINLAAAAGEDLAQVSDIVTDNLSAFGLKASDTAHFADVLAAAAANSNTNISIMGETFKSSSSVAGALGYSVEDVAVMIGLMANNAVKGSRAGTALRNIFDGLLGGMTLTARAFGELDYSAVNYDGSMKGLMETVKDLRGYFDQMTEAEKVMNAQNIAGMRGYNGLLAILNATDEDFQSLYGSINNCTGAAERMASVKLDNLNGDITLMNSAMEALQSTIGEQFNPELRELTQLKTELLNWANDFIQDNPALVKGVMAGGAAFAAMGTAIVGVNAAIKAFKALNLMSLFTGPAGTLLSIAGGIAVVTAGVVGLNAAIDDSIPSVRELTKEARELREAMEESEDAYRQTAMETQAAAEAAGGYIDALENMEREQGQSARSTQEYQGVLGLLLRTMPELSDRITETTDAYGRSVYALDGDTQALRENTEEIKRNAEERAKQEYMESVYDNYGDAIQKYTENEIELRMAQAERAEAQEKLNKAVERQNYIMDQAHNNWEGFDPDEIAAMKEEYEGLTGEIERYSAAVVNADSKAGVYELAMKAYADAVEEAEKKLDGYTSFMESMENLFDGDSSDNADELSAAVDKAAERVKRLGEAYTEAYEEAKESFSGQFGLFDEAKADAEATVAAAQKALDTQLAYWQEYAANIVTLKEISAEDLGVTQENYNALMEYVRSGTPEAAGLAADMVKAVNGGNTQVLTNLANTLGAVKASEDEAAGNVAEWTAGLNEQMDLLIQDMEEDIAALDMSEEAAENGRATIQRYIDAADDMLPFVKSAYARVAQAAYSAMGFKNPIAMIYDPTYRNRYGGYASGTSSAPPGWAWVGEEGPELMRMHGGEQILPSHVSQEAAQAYRAYSEYSGEYAAAGAIQGIQRSARPALEVIAGGQTSNGTKMEMHFHIEAGASPETVNAWQDYANRGELKAVVLEVMEEADADMRRRVMA